MDTLAEIAETLFVGAEFSYEFSTPKTCKSTYYLVYLIKKKRYVNMCTRGE
jgi:hypothetical protein